MFHIYGLHRLDNAHCLRKRCRAPLAKRTFAKCELLANGIPPRVSTVRDNYHQYSEHWRRIPLPQRKDVPYFRAVLFKNHRPKHQSGWRSENEIERFTRVETVHDLQIVLGGLFSRIVTWEKLHRIEYMKTLEKLVLATKPMNKKSFTSAYELPDFTRIFERYVHYGFPISGNLLFHGLKAAACGNSPAAMRHYISFDSAFKVLPHHWDMIVKYILVTTRSPPSRSEESLRQKKAWAELLEFRGQETLTDIESSRDGMTRRISIGLYDLLIRFGEEGWSNYFRLLSRFCASRYIFDVGTDCLVLGIRDRDLPPATLNFIFNSYIQTLLAKKSPGRAWELAQKALPEFGTIQDKTWKLLLRHPEFLTHWNPDMKKPVTDALNRYMSKAERKLGVKWTGGEDGFHMPRGEENGPQ